MCLEPDSYILLIFVAQNMMLLYIPPPFTDEMPTIKIVIILNQIVAH